MLEKVISGGQTGVDRAALEAAERFGIPTGGWAPLGFRTEDGPRPDLGTRFGIKETMIADYDTRTYKNVEDSDATLWVGPIGSPGYRSTFGACERLGKLFIVCGSPDAEDVADVAAFLGERACKVLNVAGNRLSRNPNGPALAQAVLSQLFTTLGHKEKAGG